MSISPPNSLPLSSPASASSSSAAALAPARRRLSSTDRRSQLLAHAVELFSRRGFSGTRTKDIAAACGVSEGILFRHFATKEDFYRAILDTHADEGGSAAWMAEMKRWANANNDRELVRCVASQVIRSFREDAAFHRLMLYAWLEGHSLADMVHQQMGLPMLTFLCKYIAKRQREGVFRAGEPGVMVLAIYAPAMQYAMSKYIFGKEVLKLADEDIVEELTELLLAGLRSGRVARRKK